MRETIAKCLVCGMPAKARYCSRECRLIEKVRRTRANRPLKDHVCRCQVCGREFRLGRPRKAIPEFVQGLES